MEIVSDEEVFRAALDFVDDFVADDDGGAVTTTVSCTPRAPPSKRLRTDLIALRVEAETLQRELARLKGSLMSTRRTRDTTETIVLSAWESLASRQKKHRQQAEAENSGLRALLREQARAARRLQKLIQKRCWDETSMPRSLYPGMTAVKDLTPIHTAVDHEQLLKQVQDMYTQIYAIFGAPGFTGMASEPEPVRNLVTRDNQKLGRVVEMLESRVYPYDYRTVSDAVWDPLTRLAVPRDNCTGRKFGTTTDTAINLELAFESGPPVTFQKGVLRSKVVGRRMKHDSADVVVWAMALDAEFSEQRFSSVEKLWMLVRPLSGDAPSSGAIVQIYVKSSRPQQEVVALARCTRHGSDDALGDYEGCLRDHMDDFWASVEALLLDANWSQRAHEKHATPPTAD